MTTTAVNVASEVCAGADPTMPVQLECSLCLIGFPQVAGAIVVTFYGPVCAVATDPVPSVWLGASGKNAGFRCLNPGENLEPDPNTWQAIGYFGGIVVGACQNQYRYIATLTAISEGVIGLAVQVQALVATAGGCEWGNYFSWSETLTEIANADTTRYRNRNFLSPEFRAVTPNTLGGEGDPVSFAKSEVHLFSWRLGCGGVGQVLPYCGMWDGTQWLTCCRGFIRSTNNAQTREFTQLGFNVSGCGGASYCYCDTVTVTASGPPATGTAHFNGGAFIAEFGWIGCLGEALTVPQQIQVADPVESGIQLILKQPVYGGAIYICTNDNGAGWICSVATVAQANSPRILTATRTNFDVWLYALNFPNTEILAEGCGNGGDYPEPSGGDPWWCLAAACTQSAVQPVGATGGPYTLESDCLAAGCEGFAMAGPAAAESLPFQSVPEQSSQRRDWIRQVTDRAKSPCVSLGVRLEAVASCGCAGGHLHECSRHGTCRRGGMRTVDGVASCWDCADYSAKSPAIALDI